MKNFGAVTIAAACATAFSMSTALADQVSIDAVSEKLGILFKVIFPGRLHIQKPL
jgi:hypothetical protein